MPQIIVIGEALVEIMRPDKGTALDQPGIFQGPFASGAPAIFAVAAARLGLSVGLIGSAEEARMLTGLDDDKAAAAALLKGPERTIVFKRGAAGASIFKRDGRLDIPGFAVTEVDPTGAGDCFNAALVYGLQAGWPAAQMGQFACAAGALAVTRQGPMEGAPTIQEVNDLITNILLV